MFIIDRIEGQWAVIEYGSKTFNLPLSILPSEVEEGDVIQIQISRDEKTTTARKEAIKALAEELFEE